MLRSDIRVNINNIDLMTEEIRGFLLKFSIAYLLFIL